MKISLRFLYLLPMVCILLTAEGLSDFLFRGQDSPKITMFGLTLLGASLAASVLFYRYMERVMQRWLLGLVAVLLGLALESYAGWNSWMVYPHVFSKFLALLYLFAIYGFHRRFGLPPVGLLMGLLMGGLSVSLLVFHPEALSISAFLENERGFVAQSAILLLLPTLYYFNQYLAHGGLLRLLVFLGGLLFIVFLQHRSVWVSTSVALLLNVGLVAFGRVARARFSTQRLLPMLFIPLIVLISGGLVVISDPKISKKLSSSIQDIMHPSKRGTGNWRLRQFQAYEPYMLEYPLAGMRLQGFELPVQFFTEAANGGGDEPVWSYRTGHHFHSFYVDRIFYFGVLGLLFTVVVPVGLLVRRLRQPLPLPPPTAAIMVFVLSLLVFGFSYDWSFYFFGLWGLALAAAAPVWQPRRLAAPTPLPTVASLVVPNLAHRYAHTATATPR
ncbi:O-antigen ligase family protein [Hymenobacter artigasi]|uniref:O-antigen ligase-related domain-containing protein n=1 Tax=Hymenobacter artigasi TaxID=2719616 RepID=A0ABX1HEE4_9BACT|nr:O-antigen ligase family protein [Hymenobacter artigasi]NKI88618.1 hypothetical protein [Hymenobacter artigasi]